MPGSTASALPCSGPPTSRRTTPSGSSPRGSSRREFAGRGRLLRRFEHDCVARDQRGDDVAVGEVRREIVGPEDGEHAVRLVPHRDPVAERRFELPLRRALGIGVDRNSTLSTTAPTSVLASHKGLPVSLEISSANSASFLADDVGEAADRLDPVGVRMRRPVGPCRACRGDFGRGIANLARPDLFAGRGLFEMSVWPPPRDASSTFVNLPVHPAGSRRSFDGSL